jgi:pyruvate dehydrogenase (quinone)
VALAERLQAPVVHALRGKEFIEYVNPYDVGMNGLLGIRSGFEAMKHCEALLMLGTDFPYQQFYPTDAWVCQVDLRPEQLGRRARLDLGLVGNIKDTLTALLPRLQKNTDSAHLEACQEQFHKTTEGLLELAVPTPADAPIHPQHLARCISELASDDAVFTVDVGTPHLGGALPADERSPPPGGQLEPRLDGWRDAPGHRRTVGVPETAGGDPLGRRRLCDAHG